jgi:hypothetical protein
MTTPSGQISLADVNTELGYSATALITMNDAAVRTLAGVGGSGTQISMQNLQGKSNRVTANITLSSDTANYTLNTAKVTGYDAGKTDATLTINSGVVVYSGSTGSYALTVDTSWASGDTVTIINSGTILGDGGNGSAGSSGPPISAGGGGGPALLVQRAITMNNLNRIAGGGGGGGGGAYNIAQFGTKSAFTVSGGGGGGGIGGGSGGAGGGTNPFGTPGTAGTLTSAGPGGAGGSGSGTVGGTGGNGGSYGSSGSSGGSSPHQSGASGGGAGACIVGNSNITYTNTGTRNGSIS